MHSPEEIFLEERIAALLVPVHMARHNRKSDSARNALWAIPGAQFEDVDLRKNRTFCCGAGGGCFWKEEEKAPSGSIKNASSSNVAKQQTLALGRPFALRRWK
jgi:Fe-S oxidoreductase